MVGRRVDFGVRETPVIGGSSRGREGKTAVAPGGTVVESTSVKKKVAASPFGGFGKRVGNHDYDYGYNNDDAGDQAGGGMDQVGGKSIYEVWNDDDGYEELA